MNEQNLHFLKENIKYLGFGDKLYPELEKNLDAGKPGFALSISTVLNNENIGATLYFRKSDNSDVYFLNRYEALLQKVGDQIKSQTFFLDNGKGVTWKEAYNLLEGRSVLKELSTKEGQKYQAWQKLDFSQRDEKGNHKVQHFHTNYGYNLEAAIKNLPLAAMSEERETQIFKSLQKGNIQMVSILDHNEEKKMYIAANPQFKTLDMFDGNMKPLTREQKAAIQYQPDSVVQQKKTQSPEAAPSRVEAPEIKTETPKKKEAQNQEAKQEPEKKPAQMEKKQEAPQKKEELKTSKKNIEPEKVKKLLPQKGRSGNKKGVSLK
jgi:hypothetical protein